MERVLSAEEKIRRAEEIYARRKNQNYRNTTATVNVSGNNKDFKLLKKMIIQVLICLLIYFIYYLIQTTNYVFSASTINKTKEILDYDIDVKGIYTEIKNNFLNDNSNKDNQENANIIENEQDTEKTNIEESNNIEVKNEEINQDEINADNASNKEENKIEENQEEANIEQIVNETETLTIAQEILNNYSIIKPAEGGFISSEFGTREEEGDIVTSYHNGIDIGVVVGTDVVSSTDGKVILATESSSYGKYIKIQNGDLITTYAHCNELLVKEGDVVKQGDKIALSGSTGNVTGPHLHFEIIYKGEYVNPRDILEF